MQGQARIRYMLLRSKAILACLLSLTFCSLAVAQQSDLKVHKPSQKWALLIGVNDYAYINKLSFCGADQQSLRDRLVAVGFPKDQVYLLTDNATDIKLRTTKINIDQQIDGITKLVDEDDVLLLAFS